MAEKLIVFDPAGGISVQSIPTKNAAFITLTPKVTQKYYSEEPKEQKRVESDTNVTAKGNSNSALYANMPLTGVRIAQGVDMSIAKTLNADFIVSEFGDVPVQITLSGVNFYGNMSCDQSGSAQNKQVMDFYEKNKLSTDINNRIDLSITPAASPNSGAFRCVLVKMTATAPIRDGQGVIPAYTYELNLIGVRR